MTYKWNLKNQFLINLYYIDLSMQYMTTLMIFLNVFGATHRLVTVLYIDFLWEKYIFHFKLWIYILKNEVKRLWGQRQNIVCVRELLF